MATVAYKERTKPKNLCIYEALHSRKRLNPEDYSYYLALKKGYEGECQFDACTASLDLNCLILNSLQLEIGHSPFQLDALLLLTDRILLYEVKNFEGIHYWGKEKFVKPSGKGMENPLFQLKRAKVRLELLLQELDCLLPVEAAIVYMNPEFTLLQAPADEPFLLLSQLPAHFRSLQKSGWFKPQQTELADELVRLHDADYLVGQLPEYQYPQLRKGINCPACGGLLASFKGYSQICPHCGKKMRVKEALKKAISDFCLLFPNQKITTDLMMDWCGSGNKDRIYRILREEYQPKGRGHGRYYV